MVISVNMDQNGMKHTKYLLHSFQVVLLISLMFSCKQQTDELDWEIEALVPLGKTSLNLDDIIPDSLLGESNDGIITLVFDQALYEVEPIELLNMPDTHYQFRAYLDSIKLSAIELEEQVTLGDILTESGFAAFIPNGSTMALPAINGISSSDIQINASQYFTTMTLSEGFLDLTIINHLPINITNLIFEVMNASDQTIISRDTFALILSNSQEVKTISLAGKTVEGQLVANIINMDSPGTGGTPVTINYSNAIISRLKVYNLRPYEATAVFPAQDLVNKGDKVYFNIGEIELDYIEAITGFLSIQSYNTIEDPVHFMYKLPGLTNHGDTFLVNGTVAGAQNGVATVVDQTHDVSGYSLDLRGAGPFEQASGNDLNMNGYIDNDTINTAFLLAKVSIDSTGNLIHLSLQDSFIFRSALTELVPLYATGFLGRDTLPIVGSATLELPEILRKANIGLEKTSLRIQVSNQFGFSNEIAINQIKATNTFNGQSVNLDVSQLPALYVGKPIDPLTAAIEVVPTQNEYVLNEQNSNITALTEIFPDLIEYDFTLYVNPGVTPPPLGQGTDFIYNASRLKASLNMEIPLEFVANNLSLSDTFPMDGSSTDFSAVKSGTLYFIFDNQYPLDASLAIQFIDTISNTAFPVSLLPNTLLGVEDSEVTHRTILELSLTTELIDYLIHATGVAVTATFNSSQAGSPVKIYQSKSIALSLSGKFTYTVNSEE